MRKNLRGHTHTDTFRALCKQERESYRKFRRLLVPSVVAVHPVRDAGVEDDFLSEFAESGLDVTHGGIGVAGKYVTPVTLAVYGKSLLTQLDHGSQYGSVSVRVVFHSFTHESGYFRE